MKVPPWFLRISAPNTISVRKNSPQVDRRHAVGRALASPPRARPGVAVGIDGAGGPAVAGVGPPCLRSLGAGVAAVADDGAWAGLFCT